MNGKRREEGKVKTSDLETRLRELYGSLLTATSKTQQYDPGKYKDETRSKIALCFVNWFFRLIVTSLVFVGFYNLLLPHLVKGALPIDPKDLILVITGAVGSPLGFVVGYYFKDVESDR
jgi:hypothetical protein